VQRLLFGENDSRHVAPFRAQLLKWIGNKQRFAHEIASYVPEGTGTYFEPFLGGGGVLGTLRPKRAVASDVFVPLMQIWQTLQDHPPRLKEWYAERWRAMASGDKVATYERMKASYNASPNPADLLFLCRSCYGGVVRFRQSDGYMSTPCGIHQPIPPDAFARRVDLWCRRTEGAQFFVLDFEEAMGMAKPGDMVYCDPPYRHSQRILYGAQSFSLERLFEAIARCKSRGVLVALSIDGTKKSGSEVCHLPIPSGLFEREVLVNCGRSMLKRFQMPGRTLETEVVADRLLLTY
jgi:DNA adenine methylase